MNYLIKNKDRVLAVFDWSVPSLPVLTEDVGLPKFVSDDLYSWLQTRTPPKKRAHMEELMAACGLKSTRDVVDYSKGLSLVDTMWVCKKDERAAWKDVSLFTNEFNDVIARIAFNGGLHGLQLSTTSPEFATNGRMAKCWHRDSDGVQLYKAGSTGFANAGREPYSEVMAHQIISALGYPHVPYSIARFHGHNSCRCPIFTTEQNMFVPMFQYIAPKSFTSVWQFCVRAGLKTAMAQMLVADFMTVNPDRHANNFGVMLNADTFALTGMAPIYDNDLSMFCYLTSQDTLDGYPEVAGPALYETYEEGAQLALQVFDAKKDVRKLIGFKFDRSALPGQDDTWTTQIEEWLQRRVQQFLSL